MGAAKRLCVLVGILLVIAACGGDGDEEGTINLTGEMGTYSRGTVRLECQDCG